MARNPARNERFGNEHRIFAPANSLAGVNLKPWELRPYWKGYLKLALVSCPIALHAACECRARRHPADQQGHRQSPAPAAHR
jgi:hypothetical protein